MSITENQNIGILNINNLHKRAKYNEFHLNNETRHTNSIWYYTSLVSYHFQRSMDDAETIATNSSKAI